MYQVGNTLTFASVRGALADGLAHISSGDESFHLGQLAEYDSAALAVLMSWRRAAAARTQPLTFVAPPAGLLSLAHAYGVADLLFAPAG
ncbi:STAS domain-containing protein [Chitinasiproducens palmae]|uniref:Phospholipid transport system transporter-binding protein n=1 Tax=Chitinasiproducens palmae TaxID=1770053 RepID=A0A1H2PVH0_9BURK|nr:phospholipid transport system transporter-binding protein [Chitinasiproducens palmae]